MPGDYGAAEIEAELKQLRKGRGIAAPQLPERVGPALNAVCGIANDDDFSEIRRKVAECLQSLIVTLPDSLQIGVRAALGIHEKARMPFYQDRVRWVAVAIQRDDRTARRRIDEGISALAAVAEATLAHASSSSDLPRGRWHTEELRVASVVGRASTEVFEYRKVHVDAVGLTELDLALTFTTQGQAGEGNIDVDVFHGGSIVSRVMESSDRIGLALRPPCPLGNGQIHEFALRYRVPCHFSAFVCVSRDLCEVLNLDIRFENNKPNVVERLDRIFQFDVFDQATTGDELVIDDAGEVHVQFRDLVPGFAYGARWSGASGAGIQTH